MKFMTKMASQAAQKIAERSGITDEVIHGRNDDDPSSLLALLPGGWWGLGYMRGRGKNEPWLGAGRGILGGWAGAIPGTVLGALPGAMLKNEAGMRAGAAIGGLTGGVLGTHAATRGYVDDEE